MSQKLNKHPHTLPLTYNLFAWNLETSIPAY